MKVGLCVWVIPTLSLLCTSCKTCLWVDMGVCPLMVFDVSRAAFAKLAYDLVKRALRWRVTIGDSLVEFSDAGRLVAETTALGQTGVGSSGLAVAAFDLPIKCSAAWISPLGLGLAMSSSGRWPDSAPAVSAIEMETFGFSLASALSSESDVLAPPRVQARWSAARRRRTSRALTSAFPSAIFHGGARSG